MSTKRTDMGRRGESLRKLAFEPLERRLLLAVISPSQQQCLLAGLNGLADWAGTLDQYGLAAQPLPVISRSLGDSLDLSGILQQGLVTPLAPYLNGNCAPTTDELLAAIQGLSQTAGNLTITIDPASVSVVVVSQSGKSELVFHLVLQAERSLSSGISLGPHGDAMGLAFNPSITVGLSASARLDFSFGMDLAPSLAPQDAFFICVSSFSASASASGSVLAGPMNLGFYDAQLGGGSMSLDARLNVTLNDPDSDPRGDISLRELEQTPLSSLVTLTPSGSASGALSITAGSFGRFAPSGPLGVSFTSDNPFIAPDLSFTGDSELLDFTNLSNYTFLGIVDQLGNWLDRLRSTSVLDASLHLTANSRLGDLLDLRSILTGGLIAKLEDSQGVPTFRSAQTLETALETVLGLPPGTIGGNYDATTHELSYHMVISGTIAAGTQPFGIDISLDPLSNLTTSSGDGSDNNVVTVSGNGTLEVTLGVDLSPPQAELVATAAGPANGRLSADAVFSLSIGDASPVAVTVPRAVTAGNSGPDDLVAEFNTALAAAGLGSSVVAGREGDRLTLTTPGNGLLAVLEADAANPIVTEVGFRPRQMASDSICQHAFVEGASISGTAVLAAANINAAANLGFLQASVAGGSGTASATVNLQLKAPGDSSPGGRLSLDDLFAALAGNIASIVVGPQISGSVSLRLPLMISYNVPGIPTAAPELDVNWTDITNPGTLSLTFNNADVPLKLSRLSGATIADAMQNLGDYLHSVEALPPAAQPIPGLDCSIGQIVAFADRFQALAANLKEAPAGVLSGLKTAIEQAFGLDDSAVGLSWENDTVLRIDLTLGCTASKQLPIDVDLAGLGSGDPGHLVDLHGTALLTVETGAVFQLDCGIDLSDASNPRPFLYDTSNLTLSVKAAGNNIEFATVIGPLEVWIEQGSVVLDADGNPATLAVTLQDAEADGRIYLSALGPGNARLHLAGQVHVVLPVYYPTESDFWDTVRLTVTDLGDPASITFSAPDFESAFHNFDLLNNLDALPDEIDGVLGEIQKSLAAQLAGKSLPVIGDKLSDAFDFVQEIQDCISQGLRDRFNETVNHTPAVVQAALFDALGPAGLNLLVGKNPGGPVTPDDITVTTSDTDGDGLKDDQVDIDLKLGQGYTLVDTPIKFDTGLPALGLEVDGNVQLAVGFTWDLAMGINRDGFYLDTSPSNELQVELQATIPGLRAKGHLGFFQVDVSDDAQDPSSLGLTINVTLLNPQCTGNKLTFAELARGGWTPEQLLDVSIQGGATIHLDLVTSFQGDARFPSLAADLEVRWPFSGGLSGDQPTVVFDNVRLSVGEFVSDFAGPILKEVQKFTQPLQPIVDFLTTPVPVLKDLGLQWTPLDIAAALGIDTGDCERYLSAVAGIVDVIDSMPIVSDSIFVPLGSFDLSTTDLRGKQELTGAPFDFSAPAVDPRQAYPFLGGMEQAGISLPIIDDPASIFGLLTGQDVNLVLYDLPDFHLELPVFDYSLPILTVLFVTLDGVFGGDIDADMHLKFGYDTHGLRKFQETQDPWDVFSGFYISERENADGTGKPVPEGSLSVTIDAGLELNAVVAAVGVSAGVTASLNASLPDTDNDGKSHADEFLANLDRGLLCSLDVSGDVKAHLDAYLEVLGKRKDRQIADTTLAKFDLTPPQIYHDRFDVNGSDPNATQATATYLGVGPGLHVDGLSLQSPTDVDWYRFDLLRPDSVDVDVRFSNSRGNVDLQVYDAVGNLLGQSVTDQDREVVSLAGVPAGSYYARVTGRGQLNNYMLAVEPGPTSSTRVIYVSPAEPAGQSPDLSRCYYTSEPGNDANSGLSYRKPKATLQSVLATYDLGPNDLVVFDTGSYPSGATIAADDGGATYVGSMGGSSLSDVTLDGSDNSRFYGLEFLGGGTGLTIAGGGANDAADNLIQDCTFRANAIGMRIDSREPNLIEDNSFAGNTQTGLYVGPGATVTLQGNDVSGNATGIDCESKVAEIYGNSIHDNIVGMTSLQGVLGPDNPAPFGAEGGKTPNNIYGNQTGVLVPGGASGVIVHFNDIHNNAIGIEQLGDNSLIIANDIHDNRKTDGTGIGIRGAGVLGPGGWGGDLYNLIRGNDIGVWTLPGAEVRFNRIYDNTTGVYAGKDPGDPFVHHNLIYDNTGRGILVDGAQGVDIRNNTIYSTAGNGVELTGSASNVDVRNNIIWTGSGVGLYVSADSQFGYTSDYNDLYTSGGGGRVAFQGKDFYDLYDWQAEAESDLHSIGYTVVDPGLDNPQFVDLAAGDFHLLTGSTCIDAGDPRSSVALEPSPNGGRIDLGAYGDTPEAGVSANCWLRVTNPCFYTDLVPSRTYTISWDTYNVPGDTLLDIDLTLAGGDKVADIATGIQVSAGSITWTPGDFVTGNLTKRYRIRIATVDESLIASSREAFAIPNVVPGDANTFYVNDASQDGDQYTTAAGNNRNTGTSPADPKAAIRPIVLSYALGPGDSVLVDTGNYVEAVNLNLSANPIPFDPRMNTVRGALITGPTGGGGVARIDRANPFPGSVAFDLIGSDNMSVKYLTIVGAEIGVHVRGGSTGFVARQDVFSNHTRDGVRVEGASDGAQFQNCTFSGNGRHGLFVDSLLGFIDSSTACDNVAIGMALRNVGATTVTGSTVYNNATGIDSINPGGAQAVVGDPQLDDSKGNLVYDNTQGGIFASGNVLVAGNTVYTNGGTGIRLDNGADAVRNVVWGHVIGISALGSTSNILENRVYDDSDTGVIASFASNVERNVVYTNGAYGIHADRFSGLIDHNLVYESGDTSIWVEGPGTGAQITNNTVYEPCADNTTQETTVTCTEQWTIDLATLDPSRGPYTVTFQGTVQIKYQDPIAIDPNDGSTFNLGPGGGFDATTADAVPDGYEWFIPFDVVWLDLRSLGDTPWGPIELRLSPLQMSEGGIYVTSSGGLLTGYSQCELFLSFYFVQPRITVFSPIEPISQADPRPIWMDQGFSGQTLSDYQVLQVPLSQVVPGAAVPLSMNPPSDLPEGNCTVDGWSPLPDPPSVHEDRGRYSAGTGIHVSAGSSHVLLRNNAVYVEGRESRMHQPPPPMSYDIVVDSDSTNAWHSDFNIFTTLHGCTGEWAGCDAPTLRAWQIASRDDRFSIDPPVETMWVDPDGSDDRLGWQGPSLAGDGRDDNFHLRSPFGEAAQGALAPVEQFDASGTQLPVMQAVTWQYDAIPDENYLSPGADWSDPAYDYSQEPVSNGKLIDLGAYGNTDQASQSAPQYVHIVYPLGFEQLLQGETYEIQWRSEDPMDPSELVRIELRHGDSSGPLETVIADWTAPNTGSYLWTVPVYVAPANDYVVVVLRGGVTAEAPGVVGASRRWFSIEVPSANLVPGFAVTNYQANLSIGSLADAQSVIDNPADQSWSVSETAATINYLNTGSGAHFGGDKPFPNMAGTAECDNFVVRATGIVFIPSAGEWTFGVNSDDGFSLELGGADFQSGVNYTGATGGDTLLYDSGRGPGDTLGTFSFPAAGNYELTLVYFQGWGGAEVELYAAEGTKTTFDSAFRLVGDTANGGLSVSSAPMAGFAVTNYKASTASIGSLADAQSVIDNPADRSWSVSETAATINYLNTGPDGQFAGGRPFPNMPNQVEYNNFVLRVTGTISVPSGGDWTFGVTSDDGFSLELTGTTFVSGTNYSSAGDDTLACDWMRSASDTLGTFNFLGAGNYDLTLLYFQNYGGAALQLWAAQGMKTGYDNTFRLVGDTANGGLSVTSAGAPGFAVTNYKANLGGGVWNLASAQSVIDNPAWSVSETAATINYVNTGWGGHFAGDRSFPGMPNAPEYDRFVVKATGSVYIPSAGDWTFGVNSDDGFSLQIGGATFVSGVGCTGGTAGDMLLGDLLRGANDTLGTFNFPAAGGYGLTLVYFQNGGAAEVELWAAQGIKTIYDNTFRLVGDTANGGLAMVSIAAQTPGDAPPPTVLQTSPQLVELGQPTNGSPSRLTVTFSDARMLGAGDPAAYEFRWAGPDGTFDDGDDVVYPLAALYAPGVGYLDQSTAVVSLLPAPYPTLLPPGNYRFTVHGSRIMDSLSRNFLDGNGDGTAGDDCVRFFTIDRTAPAVSIAGVVPNLRNTPVSQITIVFTEAVRGLGLDDVRLTRDGGADLLTGANILTSSDGITWTLPNLDGATAADGNYTLELTPANLDIRDLAGNSLAMSASTTWTMETTRPTAQFAAVASDPSSQGVSQVTLVFSKAVVNFDLDDLTLTRNGVEIPLTGDQVLSTSDSANWTLGNLAALTSPEGIYMLTLDGETSGITDLFGNSPAAGTFEVWETDCTPPQAHIVDVAPDPRRTAVDQIVIVFNEPVAGVNLADLSLTRDGGENLLTGDQTVATTDGMNWTLGNLGGLTAPPGRYVLTLTAAGSGIQDLAGNPLPLDAVDTWVVDTTPPTAGIVAVDPDPRHTPVGRITIQFGEPVTGFNLADLSLTCDGGGNLLTGGAATLTSSDNATWTLGNLAPLTAANGEYRLTLSAAGSGIQDAAGNPLAGDAVETWVRDAVPPSVSIIDVTPAPSISPVSQIQIVFSKPVDHCDLCDLVLTYDGGDNLLPGSATLTTMDDATWTLGNLAGLTNRLGAYALLLAAPGSQIADRAGNLLQRGTKETWVFVSHTMTWNGSADDDWENGTRWTGSPPAYPDRTVDTVVDTPRTIIVDNAEEANSLAIGNAGCVAIASNGALTITEDVSVTAGARLEMTVGATVSVGGTLTVDDGSVVGGALNAACFDLRSGTVIADLSGPGSLTKDTGGTVTLSGNNDCQGGTTVNDGTLIVASAGALTPGTNLSITGNGAVVLASDLGQAIDLSALSIDLGGGGLAPAPTAPNSSAEAATTGQTTCGPVTKSGTAVQSPLPFAAGAGNVVSAGAVGANPVAVQPVEQSPATVVTASPGNATSALPQPVTLLIGSGTSGKSLGTAANTTSQAKHVATGSSPVQPQVAPTKLKPESSSPSAGATTEVARRLSGKISVGTPGTSLAPESRIVLPRSLGPTTTTVKGNDQVAPVAGKQQQSAQVLGKPTSAATKGSSGPAATPSKSAKSHDAALLASKPSTLANELGWLFDLLQSAAKKRSAEEDGTARSAVDAVLASR
jgi:autotransporter-associated beta strand protein